MRPVLPGDLSAAARALLDVPAPLRAARAAALLAEADAADRYRKHAGRAHAGWGDGTLMGRALRLRPPPEPRLDDPDYLHCLLVTLGALEARQKETCRLSPRSRAKPDPARR